MPKQTSQTNKTSKTTHNISIIPSTKKTIARRGWFASMSNQLIIAFVLVALIGVSLIGGYGYLTAQDYIHDGIEASYTARTAISDQVIEGMLKEIQDDLRIAANAPALKGLLQARDNGGNDPVSGMSYVNAARYVENLFEDMAQTSQRYSQLRYLDENGNEVARVDYNGAQIQKAPASELQNQANQPYFQQTMQLPSGHIYVSRLGFDRKYGQALPIVRYATPVFNELGERRGIVVFDVMTEKVFHQLAVYHPQEKGSFLFVADPITGRYAHKSAYPVAKEWGDPAGLSANQGVRADFPEIAGQILSGHTGELYTGNWEVFYSPIQAGPTSSDYWIVGLAMPLSVIQAPTQKFTWVFIGVLTLSLLLASIVGFLIARRISGPLETLREGTLQVTEGNLQREVHVSGSMETADLAEAFNQMTRKLRNSFDQIRRRTGELEAIAQVGGLVTAGGELQTTLDTLARKIAEATFQAVAIAVYDEDKQELTTQAVFTPHPALAQFLEERKAITTPVTESPALQQMLRERQPIFFDDPQHDPRVRESIQALARKSGVQTATTCPLVYAGKLIGRLDLFSVEQRGFSPEDLRLLSTLADHAAVAVRNAHLFAETRQRLHELEALFDISSALRVAKNVDEMWPIILDKTVIRLGASVGAIIALDRDSGGKTLRVARSIEFGATSQPTPHLDEMPAKCVMKVGGHCFGLPDCPFSTNKEGIKISCITLKVGDEILGGLYLGVETQNPFSQSDLSALDAIANMAGNAIHRARLFDDVKLYRDVFYSVGDAVAITDMRSRIVDINPAFENTTGYSRDETLGKKPSILKSRHTTLEFYRAMWAKVLNEGSWKGEIINQNKNGKEWDSLLTISAVQDERGRPVGYVGINKDITELKNLERELREYANALEDTYINTLRTLSAAIELRDHETQGHTERVTDMTMKLMRAIGLSKEEFIHVHRGALLHDIGKLGVPDSILHKPDQLTDEEWAIMRKHPQYAYDMLSPIAYLRPALDIPYCHHEKWDGTGYPRGLKGEQIPLAARLFAVVDVWDALTSDRPYRKAWPKEKVIEHIKAGSGAHFDPKAIELFLRVINEKAEEHQGIAS